MGPGHQRAPGRPRGSGATATILGIALNGAESVPYRAGLRLGRTDPDMSARWCGDLAEISPYLSLHERAQLAIWADEKFAAWVRIGMDAAALSWAVAVARGA